jgi:lipoprotein Spr
MTMAEGRSIALAARACVGVPFRPQGRDRGHGLDCVGLVAVACTGRLTGMVPANYAQRGGSMATIISALKAAGLAPIEVAHSGEGDILLLSTGPAQWHLAVLTEDGFIHADARLRRVVEVPGRPEWAVASAWRAGGER